MAKWCFLPYDFDTGIGTNNEGALAFSYELEDIDKLAGADVFNGQNSVLWKNLRQAYFDKIKQMYQELRSQGKLSYEDTERRFEEHQAAWSEAIFNEDSYFKYLAPLINDNTSAYLSMLQGSKAEQRKWWLYNRFRYIDSKYNAGDALTDVITVRGYAKSDITVTPYADIYASVKYGSYLTQMRALRGNSYTLKCPLDNVNDTEIYIYSASQLKDIGDLSGLKIGYAEFSLATKLQAIKVGDADESYANPNLTELHLGNNTLLRKLDVRNCPNLTQTVDISGCSNVEFVYFDGTSVAGILLPPAGILKELHLPAMITNLTIRNQPSLYDLTVPDYSKITTLRLENVNKVVDSKAILKAIPANSRVRLLGIDWTAKDADDLMNLIALLDAMRGLDENGNNLDTAQVSGTISVDTVTGAQVAEIQSKYPDIKIAYQHITSFLYFYNDTGTTLLYTQSITDGADGVYSGGTPSKSSTAQYTYSFAGWSKKTGGSADSTALKAVVADRNVYAAFTATVRRYTVYFYNGSTLLQKVENVAYGSSATYTGNTPVSSEGSAEDYPFEGFVPTGKNITGNTNCYAQFGSPILVEEITDSWEDIIASCNDETYKKYKIGMYKTLVIDGIGTFVMQIKDYNVHTLLSGESSKMVWEAVVTPYSCALNEKDITIISKRNFTGDTFIFDGVDTFTFNNDLSLSDKDACYIEGACYSFVIDCTERKKISIRASRMENARFSYTFEKIHNDGSTTTTNFGELRSSGVSIDCENVTSLTVKIKIKPSYEHVSNDTEYFIKVEDISGTLISNIKSEEVQIAKEIENGTGAVGGWEHSLARRKINEDIYNAIPTVVRNAIKEVKNSQIVYNSNFIKVMQNTNDKIFIRDNSRKYVLKNTTYNEKYSDISQTNAVWYMNRNYSNKNYYIRNGPSYTNHNPLKSAYIAIMFCF